MDNQIGGISAEERPSIPNHMVLAIVSTLCCGCPPLGIVGIVFASQVDKFVATGNYAAAENASKKARLFAILAIVLGLLVTTVSVVLAVLSGFIQSMNNR